MIRAATLLEAAILADHLADKAAARVLAHEADVGTAATSTYGGIVHAECRVDFYDGGDYWSLSGPLCRSQTMPGSFVVADKRHGGDYVFPMAGRDVEVYLPGEEDPIIQYRGLRCVRGVPS